MSQCLCGEHGASCRDRAPGLPPWASPLLVLYRWLTVAVTISHLRRKRWVELLSPGRQGCGKALYLSLLEGAINLRALALCQDSSAPRKPVFQKERWGSLPCVGSRPGVSGRAALCRSQSRGDRTTGLQSVLSQVFCRSSCVPAVPSPLPLPAQWCLRASRWVAGALHSQGPVPTCWMLWCFGALSLMVTLAVTWVEHHLDLWVWVGSPHRLS